MIYNNESTKNIVHEKHEKHEQDMLLFVFFVPFVDSLLPKDQIFDGLFFFGNKLQSSGSNFSHTSWDSTG